MEFLDVPALHRAHGVVRLPGSKSISNRTLLLAALAEGSTDIHDLLDSDDTRVMLAGLRALGVLIAPLGPDGYRVHGVGGPFPVRDADLFLGNAGTAFRPLTAALALSGGHYRLSGVARMHERPIGDLVDGLRQIGCGVDYLGREGYPPLAVKPAAVRLAAPIRVRGDVSSQFLTALLMALPLTGEAATIEMTTELISKPYIEITLRLMARFGVRVEREGWQRFTIPGGQRYRNPGTLHVEGDASSASYFLAAGAIAGVVLGGIIGTAMENKGTQTQGIEVTVKMNDGREVAIVQEHNPNEMFQVGEQVRLITVRGETRVAKN